MKILKQIILILLLLSFFSFADSKECYKEAPLPHYNYEKGYGYWDKIPCDKPNYVNSIIKEWREGNAREIFLDAGINGTCDVVFIYEYVGNSKEGKELVQLKSIRSCEFVEKQIKRFLRIKEGREES